MITFNCTCGQYYRVPLHGAGQRVKCKSCGELLVVPEAAYESAEDLDQRQEPEPPRRGQAVRTRGDSQPEAEDEPVAYQRAENVSRSLAVVGQTLGLLGVVVSLGAAVWAVSHEGGESVALMFLVGTLGSLMYVLTVEVAKHAVLVLVDLARNARAIRREIATRQPNN